MFKEVVGEYHKVLFQVIVTIWLGMPIEIQALKQDHSINQEEGVLALKQI
jgi:hypothetical protein